MIKSSLRLMASTLAASAVLAQAGFLTTNHPYVIPVGPDYTIVPLLSAGDRVPHASDPTREYQTVGIPDGMGAYKDSSSGHVYLFVNHELRNNNTSQALMGGPLERGAIISKFTLALDGSVLAGERAYDRVYQGDSLVGSAPTTANLTPAFNRFCSGSYSGP